MYGRKNTKMDVITIKLEIDSFKFFFLLKLIGNFNIICTIMEIDVQKFTLFQNCMWIKQNCLCTVH